VPAACAEADVVVVSTEVEVPPVGCDVYDKRRLFETGALALWPEKDGVRIESVADQSGARPWTGAR
jgi:competence protein ComEC